MRQRAERAERDVEKAKQQAEERARQTELAEAELAEAELAEAELACNTI